MNWCNCMYDETSHILTPIVSAIARERLIREGVTAYLDIRTRHWDLDVIRTAILIELFSHHFRSYHLTDKLVRLLVSFHDDVPKCDVQCFLYYIAYERLGMRTLPHILYLSDAIFKRLLTESLEPFRPIRVNLKVDTQVFIIITVLYAWWSREYPTTLFSSRVMGIWHSEIARANPETIKSTATFLRDHNINRSQTNLRSIRKMTKCFSWRQQRKRKRETTDAIGDCGVCFDTQIKVQKLRCGHGFCTDCLQRWEKPTCPTCRARS